ncbi:uncharacterized protein PV07_03790 [Cladophialophora immunda]|uniref:Uncharacterized protein n=1 Tax=Cladophialophora immunda TaxID=569365 RepID=A0A0D2CQI0_9EURO|nr:uncharacterized protein PV07_03790 [Cladophialophora immunda]KIW32230.1 hypothetical protein PV07_03790 [Cladophialophora immunda]OQV03654.1 hypothetical protein CLAIMM_08671 [Cladophialophora immunda]
MSALPSNDLRSAAKPYLREKNHNKKWARGAQEPPEHNCHKHTYPEDNCRKCMGRPNRRDQDRRVGRSEAKHKHDIQNKLSGHAATLARKAFRNEVVDAMDGPLAHVSDTSEEEEVPDASEAPLPAEGDFMYSYDHATGPRAGGDILSQAIIQAVRRFENNETEKLVNTEYNIIDDKEMAEASTEDDDDDFELVDYSHLK